MRKLFFGSIFIIIGLIYKGFDIFPDLIGYILVFQGSAELLDREADFEKLQKLAVAGGVFSLLILGFDIVASLRVLNQTTTLLGGIISSALGLLLSYMYGTQLLDSFSKLNLNEQGEAMVSKQKRFWSSYFTALSIARGIALYLLFNPQPQFLLIIAVGALISMIYGVIFLYQLNKFTAAEVRGEYVPGEPLELSEPSSDGDA